MKSWSSIKWNIHYWFWNKSWIYINTLNVSKCYREWIEVKKYFTRPHWAHPLKYDWRWCIFRLEIRPLGWKTKWGEYRHEENPKIMLCVFGKMFEWQLCPGKDEHGENIDLQYWETVLLLPDLLKKHTQSKAVWEAIENNTWSKSVVNMNVPINAYSQLTIFGKHMYDVWNNFVKKGQAV